nr:PcfJ domain-containing protein [Anaerotruncus sp. 1XD42-93]
MKLLRSKPAYEINRILTDGFKKDFWRILRYLKNQKGQWYTLQDYWNMAQRLHRDLSDSLVRWPRSLKAAHDQVMAEQKAREDAALNEMFIERAEELQYLSFELNGLLIRPCQNETELIREGKDLHHCVATYAKRHAEGKTAILFIRQVAEPNIPFFTLEFDEETKTVRQNRGLRNCGRTPEVTAFETAWLNHVRHVRPKERTKIA